MGNLSMILGGSPSILRDMKVSLVNAATSERREVTPFLDGTIKIANIEPGNWQVVAKHPNLLFDVVNRPIRIFPDRPTFTRIPIPENIFSNSAVVATADADLGPSQAKLGEAESDAREHARKVAGQPIFADDWNALSATLADTAKATQELAGLVSPIGHDHPELVAKMGEIQTNLQSFYDLFARSLAELQRQIEQLALQRKVDDVVDKVPTLPPLVRDRMRLAIDNLAGSYQDSPSIYGLKKQRVGELLQTEISAALVDATPEVLGDAAVKDFQNVSDTIASSRAVTDYASELKQRQRAENASKSGTFFDAVRGARARNL